MVKTLCKYYEKLLCCKSDLPVCFPSSASPSLIHLSVSFHLAVYVCRQVYPKPFPVHAVKLCRKTVVRWISTIDKLA